jgi:hypothetical protein
MNKPEQSHPQALRVYGKYNCLMEFGCHARDKKSPLLGGDLGVGAAVPSSLAW